VLREHEYGVDGHLLLAVKSLYSFSEVCVRFSGFKSQRFIAGAEHEQSSVLSPFLPMIFMNWLDNRSPATRVALLEVAGHLFFADDLLLLASSEWAFST